MATTPKNIVADYTYTNSYLQNMAVSAGAGKVALAPKLSLMDAANIVDDFLTYNDITVGVLQKFKGNCLQFEKTGKIFHTESALTQAILEDSASRAVPIDKRMVAFVSTSAHAVSSDAIFLHRILQSLENDTLENPLIPQTTTSVNMSSSSENDTKLYAKTGLGFSIYKILTAGLGGSKEKHTKTGLSQDITTTGSQYVDSKYRETLNGISAVYSLEKAGVIQTGAFTEAMVGLATIASQKTGDAQGNIQAAERILTDSVVTVNTVNDAWVMERDMQGFLSAFCTDNRIKAINKNPHDPNDVKFWDMLKHAVDYRTMDALPLMQRYIDHHDQPDALMAFSLLKMWNVLNQTASEAVQFLRLGIHDHHMSEHSRLLRRGVSLKSIHVSPILPDGQALAVVEDPYSKTLRSGPVDIRDATSMYPELCKYIKKTEFYVGKVSDADWEPFMDDVKSINADLLNDWNGGVRHEVDSEFSQTTDVTLSKVVKTSPNSGLKSKW